MYKAGFGPDKVVLPDKREQVVLLFPWRRGPTQLTLKKGIVKSFGDNIVISYQLLRQLIKLELC